MVMRYHYSLGIGHTYSHGTASNKEPTTIDEVNSHANPESDLLPDGVGCDSNINETTINEEPEVPILGIEENDPDPDDPELMMEDRENEDLGPELDSELRDDNIDGRDLDDDLFEMYYL